MAATNGTPAKKRPHRRRTPAAPVPAAPIPVVVVERPVTARLSDLRDPAYERRVWQHRIPEGVDWQVALQRSYWASCLVKITPGDRIECFTSAYDVAFELLVQETVPLAGHCRFLARPLFPAGLVLPDAPAIGPEPRYYMRPGAADRMWEIVDRSRDLVIKQRISRGAADDECAMRNQADAEARASVAAEAKQEAPPEPPVPADAAVAAAELAALGRADQPSFKGASP